MVAGPLSFASSLLSPLVVLLASSCCSISVFSNSYSVSKRTHSIAMQSYLHQIVEVGVLLSGACDGHLTAASQIVREVLVAAKQR